MSNMYTGLLAVFPRMNRPMRPLKKMEAMVKDFDMLYEEMAEAKAEGSTTGYGEKPSDCTFTVVWVSCLFHLYSIPCKNKQHPIYNLFV